MAWVSIFVLGLKLRHHAENESRDEFNGALLGLTDLFCFSGALFKLTGDVTIDQFEELRLDMEANGVASGTQSDPHRGVVDAYRILHMPVVCNFAKDDQTSSLLFSRLIESARQCVAQHGLTCQEAAHALGASLTGSSNPRQSIQDLGASGLRQTCPYNNKND